MALSAMLISLGFLSKILDPAIQINHKKLKMEMVFGIIISFTILVGVMMGVYAIVMRKMMATIDILTMVAQRVSWGDLGHESLCEKPRWGSIIWCLTTINNLKRRSFSK